jgi:hypothetical protein
MLVFKLSKNDSILAGKFNEDGEDIVVELDSSIGTFPVYLPDLMGMPSRMIAFKNLGANTVTVYTIHGQYIDYPGVLSKAIPYKTFYSVVSNGIDKWISLETNP